MQNILNNTNYKQATHLKDITYLKVLEFNDKEDQDIFNSDKYSAFLFTPSIRNFKLIQQRTEQDFNEVFEDFLINILYEYTGYHYVDNDFAIVITPKAELKKLFKTNYKENNAYFISVIDKFFFLFDN